MQECEAVCSPDVSARWGHSIRHSTSAYLVLVFCKGSLEHDTNTASPLGQNLETVHREVQEKKTCRF